MELDYVLLAERAARLDDGRLVVFGGDIDAVEVKQFPAVFQTTLVARMLLEPGESPEGHTFGIDCTAPSGQRVVVAENQHLNAPGQITDGLRAGAGLLANLTVVLRSSGIHRIHLIVDGQEVRTAALRVEGPLSESTEESL